MSNSRIVEELQCSAMKRSPTTTETTSLHMLNCPRCCSCGTVADRCIFYIAAAMRQRAKSYSVKAFVNRLCGQVHKYVNLM